jgi:hypothetical protein
MDVAVSRAPMMRDDDAAVPRRVETITQSRREWKDAMRSIDFVHAFPYAPASSPWYSPIPDPERMIPNQRSGIDDPEN